MKIDYVQAETPKKSLERIDALIDAHTLETYPELDGVGSQTYAIEVKVDGEFAGGIAFRQDFEVVHVNSLAVDKKYRAHRIGSELLKRMEQFALTLDVHTVTLSTLSYQALEFYQKNNYQIAGEVSDYPRRGQTKYFLFKRLANY